MSTKRRYVVLEPSRSSTSSTNSCILRVSRFITVYRIFEARKVVAMKELELIAADLKDLHESHDALAVIEALYAEQVKLPDRSAELPDLPGA